MKKFIYSILLSACWLEGIHASDLFKPVRSVALRAPSVPLITSDTYLSIWSPYNTLTEGDTEHWTAAKHPLVGAIRVDGKTYRFMGDNQPALEALVPMTDTESWEAEYTFQTPSSGWEKSAYQAASWMKGKAAFGTSDMPRITTEWKTEDIWIRRTFDLSSFPDTSRKIFLRYSHDDVFELYLNGEQLVATDYCWCNDVLLELTPKALAKLRKGNNVLAAHCHNTTGGAYVDFGLYQLAETSGDLSNVARQTAVDVLPTQTFYTFECGPVELDLVFTAPLLLDDYDLISTPINYISYRVRALDKKNHDVQVYIETTPQLAVHEPLQPTLTSHFTHNGINYLKAGTIDQPYTVRQGDGVRIDWGYAYLAAPAKANRQQSIGKKNELRNAFLTDGSLPNSLQDVRSSGLESMPGMACVENLGKVDHSGKSGYVMLGYDDVYALEYFYKRRMAYWKHNGKVSIQDAFERAAVNRESLMHRCSQFDEQLMADAEQAGGKEYAELCALVYRQAITAHKLFCDDEGNVLFFSKENHSNGCINTVDITYPSAPLFLLYNPNLVKGMMTSIFHYSESGRWTKPFPAHDLGTYPVANGMLYGGDMPIEEAGNMVMLAAAVSLVEGNAEYARQHWEVLTTWAEYLLNHGLDPENQVCTDDFAGHLAHNANLSVKAIMAIKGYAVMAGMLGMKNVEARYDEAARIMAKQWEQMANDGNHYKLAFDKPGTWSQKYNMAWDKVFNWNVFPLQVAQTEMAFYRDNQRKYGLPLDSRKEYTKNDWIMWSACLGTDDDFRDLLMPLYRYADETVSRVPISDWYDTNTTQMMNFKARSVVGGFFMKMLMQKMKK